jgi:hypothetical protein
MLHLDPADSLKWDSFNNPRLVLWVPQIPSVTNAIEISDMRKGTGG